MTGQFWNSLSEPWKKNATIEKYWHLEEQLISKDHSAQTNFLTRLWEMKSLFLRSYKPRTKIHQGQL